MKQTINFSDFIDAFRRSDRFSNFGYDGLQLLFDYLEELEADTVEELELDVIALCCDYSFDHWADIAANYDIDLSEFEEDDEGAKLEAVRDYLQDNTVLCGEVSGQFLYVCF